MSTAGEWLNETVEKRYKLRCEFKQEVRKHFTDKELKIVQVTSINLECDFLCIRNFIDDKGVPSSYCFVVVIEGYPVQIKTDFVKTVFETIQVLWLNKNTVEILVANFIGFIKNQDIGEPWTNIIN